MIKIFEDLNSGRTKNLEKSIEKIIKRLNSVKEDLQINSGRYDLDGLVDILTQIYDDIGDFTIIVDGETVNYVTD